MKTWADAPSPPPQEIPRANNRLHCKANVRLFFKLLLWLRNTVGSSVNCLNDVTELYVLGISNIHSPDT